MTPDFTTPDGLRLRARHTTPSATPRADIVLVHGLGDHVDGIPYTTAATAFAAHGFSVHRLELRGHGRSDGFPAFVDSFADFRRDLQAFVAHVRADPERCRLFLVGVSLGGLIVTDLALHHADGLAGVVAVAPALGETGGSRLLLALLPVLSRVVPRFRLEPKLDIHRLTRDRAMLRAYVDDDPLYQRRITPRLAAEVMASIAATRARARDLRVPFFALHGTADTVTSPAGSRWFFERAGAADKASMPRTTGRCTTSSSRRIATRCSRISPRGSGPAAAGESRPNAAPTARPGGRAQGWTRPRRMRTGSLAPLGRAPQRRPSHSSRPSVSHGT